MQRTEAERSTPQLDQWMVEAFRAATDEFNGKLKAPENLNLAQYDSINHVYAETTRIQAEQAKSGSRQALSRISPYLQCLTQYERIIDVFVQSNPELLCLIWVWKSHRLSFLLFLLSNIRRVRSNWFYMSVRNVRLFASV